jgi:hypothetical protein
MAGETDSGAVGEAAALPAVELVADGNPPRQLEAAAAPVAAGNSIPLYGGLRGGRSRRDGLIPGSPEAADADKLYERLRKWHKRHPGQSHPDDKKYPAVPRPLRPATVEREQAPLPGMVETDAALPASASSPGLVVDSADAPLVPWTGDDVQDLADEAVSIFEEVRQSSREGKARAAKLPETLVAEIKRDSAIHPRIKQKLAQSGARLSAKYLNKTGISSEHKDEVVFGSAVLALLASEVRLNRRLALVIAESKKQQTPETKP